MLGIPAAVDLIWNAKQRGAADCDLWRLRRRRCHRHCTAHRCPAALERPGPGYIPNRFEEGYGLNKEALESLASEGTRVVVTVDCGVRSLEEAAYTRQLGMDLIITDHHKPGAELPVAAAIVDPKQPGETYPDRNLAGVGLAFKLASALMEKAGFGSPNPAYPSPAVDYLDLVALGTVADQAPLMDENRSLVRTGLEYIRKPHRQGVLSLIGAAQIVPATISADSIGFMLGPRLNASWTAGFRPSRRWTCS